MEQRERRAVREGTKGVMTIGEGKIRENVFVRRRIGAVGWNEAA